MCIAIYKPPGAIIPDNVIKNSWDNNPDGAGLMYAFEGRLIVRKGFMKLRSFMKAYNSIPNLEERSVALHFRIATHGSVSASNTHPFWIEKGRCALMHNGILSGIPAKSELDKTDTSIFISNHLSEIYQEFPDCFRLESFVKLLEKAIGVNKFIIMESDGNVCIVNANMGYWVEEIWYSNATWKVDHRSYGGHYFNRDKGYFRSRGYVVDDDDFDDRRYAKGDCVRLLTDGTEKEDRFAVKDDDMLYICKCGERYIGSSMVYWAGSQAICPECGEELY